MTRLLPIDEDNDRDSSSSSDDSSSSSSSDSESDSESKKGAVRVEAGEIETGAVAVVSVKTAAIHVEDTPEEEPVLVVVEKEPEVSAYVPESKEEPVAIVVAVDEHKEEIPIVTDAPDIVKPALPDAIKEEVHDSSSSSSEDEDETAAVIVVEEADKTIVDDHDSTLIAIEAEQPDLIEQVNQVEVAVAAAAAAPEIVIIEDSDAASQHSGTNLSPNDNYACLVNLCINTYRIKMVAAVSKVSKTTLIKMRSKK